MTNYLPSIAQLNKLLSYNAESGKLYWKVDRGNRYAKGDEAGHLTSEGYIRVCVMGKLLRAHNVAWAIHYGRWPTNEIDHIDRVGRNNAISNLRDVPKYINYGNKSIPSDNTSGYANVGRHRGKWRARVTIQGKCHFLGHFDTAADAATVAKAFKEKHLWQA